MARKAMIEKSKRKPKFKVRVHNRCGRCGRSRAFLRRFGLCRICFRELSLLGNDPGRAQGKLVAKQVVGSQSTVVRSANSPDDRADH